MTVTLEVPAEAHVEPFEVKMMVAARLFDTGRLTSGQAAEMMGLSKAAFLELVGQYGVSIFGYSAEELAEELKR